MRSKVGETVPMKELVLKYVYDVSCETFVAVVFVSQSSHSVV